MPEILTFVHLKNDFTLKKKKFKHFTALSSLAHGLRLRTAMKLALIVCIS